MDPRRLREHDRNARLIARLADGATENLAALAEAEGLSPFHTQRSFRRWVGLTPKQFASFARVRRAQDLLAAAGTVLDTALSVGLTGPGRLHDQFVSITALSPGEYAEGGAGLRIGFGFGDTPLGTAAVAWTARGICRLVFIERPAVDAAAVLAREWPAATLRRDDRRARGLLTAAFTGSAPLALAVRGTTMQIAVWRALLEIPDGEVATYAAIARAVGSPSAARAVARIIGDNPVGYLIPCHRVIRSTGLISGYRWGVERKAALLAGEMLRRR